MKFRANYNITREMAKNLLRIEGAKIVGSANKNRKYKLADAYKSLIKQDPMAMLKSLHESEHQLSQKKRMLI